jgi:diaminopropionate ammonia-lyase|tara:strand:+ start:6121 stop:7239 length:1119 start_codon:yes stop_codon:yes gene_type:complete
MNDFFINYPLNSLGDNLTNQTLKNSDPFYFHKSLDEYNESPLNELPGLSNFFNISNLYVKDESTRFGLNAFKVLGASYAVNQILLNKPNVSVFCTATDGNHGRALAWSAEKYKKKCVVFVPKDTSDLRINTISNHGAKVEKLDLNYEDTCKYASEISTKMNWELIQDTSWDDYELVPSYIMSGYLTHFIEMEDKINLLKKPDIDIIFLQCGVGSWAASCIWYYLERYGKNKPKIILVEPAQSSGVFDSFIKGERVSPDGNLNTIMAGLNCGIPSKIAWQIIKRGCDGVVKITDNEVKYAMNVFYKPLLNDSRIISGESGAAGLAGLIKCLNNMKAEDLNKHVGLNKNSRILLFNTEGDTDKDSFLNIIKKHH